jgi:NADH-quinone oxidoreductase subunit L
MILPYYPIIILLAPFTAALITGLLGRAIGAKAGRIGVAADAIAFILGLFVLREVTDRGPQIFHFSPTSSAAFSLTLYIDRLAAVMLIHIAAISSLIHLFSIRYMQQERGYARFHGLLTFTTFALLGMVSSANLLMLFVFWQLLSWLVPLLSFNYEHAPTVRGAFRTFIMQRFGDIAFLAGIILAYSFYGSLDLHQLFARAAGARSVVALWPGGLTVNVGTVVTALIFVGAMSKSAQFPLHMWLPDSLYAPTPVHALLHAGIINAGGFLLARLAPLYAVNSATLHLVFAVGMLTAVLGSSMMLVQSDIKKTLGYSTIGQMGFMIMECGLGAYGLAIFHLIAHGLFKGSIFLNCGQVIHAARQEPRQPRRHTAAEGVEFSNLAWFTGFATTLILPLIIVLAAHGILNIPLGDSQGATIFLFFGWATSSQAILTLYRLRAVASWKVAASMLAVLFIVIVTYLFAAESFTNFLFPAPGEVAGHFRAGALPAMLFDFLVTAFALIIVVGWILIYAASHGRSFRMPQWAKTLQLHLYLLLINRLYLDVLSMRLGDPSARAIDRLNRHQLFPYVAGLLVVGPALWIASHAATASPAQGAQLIAVALLLPLFPLHGVYLAAVSRSPGYLSPIFALSMPLLGFFWLANMGNDFPAEVLSAVKWLALLGALFASLKALAQRRVPALLAYAGIALFSALWWCFAVSGRAMSDSFVYVAIVALLSAGLLLAWQFLRKRYGDLELDSLHGLARPMPRFATLFTLIVLAVVCLPPVALFAAHMQPLRQPSLTLLAGWFVILGSWFLSSWYLFKMMQRLLFGSQRGELRNLDLRAGESIWLVIMLALLVAVVCVPPAWFQTYLAGEFHSGATEMTLWRK